MSKFKSYQSQVILIAVFIVLFCASNVMAGGKLGIYFISMVPRGDDAKDYSRPGYGGGIHVIVPIPQASNFIAGTAGFEFINLMSENILVQEWPIRVEQHTDQHYVRLYLGGRVGGHGLGFIRPYAGLNLALVIYGIDTNMVIPDDDDSDDDINQDVDSENHAVFGSDITLGVDFNFWNKWNIDVGVRYLKSFSVPQQLWEGSEKIHPEYFQFYIGVGVDFRVFRKANAN